jgi:hypothetical protein
MHLGARIGVLMGVGVGQVSGTFDTPHGIEAANHMSAIENGGDIEFRAIYLCRLRNARVYLPARTLETKKGALPSMLTPLMQQKRRDRLMMTLKFSYWSSKGLSAGARSSWNAARAGTPGFLNSITTSGRPLTNPTKSGRQA